ncbi:hypothetical protein TEU_03930 [Thermococcus eurythermalis]|uniref:DUF7344 domain-containing protein n=1 Tax=Thermococcus eurythermalis TaxID=1505907 RepID=A0A097QSW7_9EURY|nr:hypothetical protein [Thermococcus eurythermalis]AIU69556.1 hypothetical protein TEU_03930 [Thermococcus eurythermalis]
MGTSSVILGNSRRMLMIEYLKKSDGRAELREMVEYIAENEGNTDRKHRKSVYVSLVQTHIPKLEREGVITFRHGVVTLVKVPDDVTVYMETVKKNDISWSSFYVGLSLIFLILAVSLNDLYLAMASLVYAGVGVIHHRKMKRI